jgi:hypothetical protein
MRGRFGRFFSELLKISSATWARLGLMLLISPCAAPLARESLGLPARVLQALLTAHALSYDALQTSAKERTHEDAHHQQLVKTAQKMCKTS